MNVRSLRYIYQQSLKDFGLWEVTYRIPLVESRIQDNCTKAELHLQYGYWRPLFREAGRRNCSNWGRNKRKWIPGSPYEFFRSIYFVKYPTR